MSKSSVSVIIDAVNNATAPIRQITRDIQALTKAAQAVKLDKALTNVGKSFSNVGKESGLLAARFAGMGAAGVGLFAAFVKPASEMENLRVRLDALYNSVAKGQQMFNWLTEFATKSPYGFQMLADSLATLKGQGFDNLSQFKGIMNYLGTRVPDQFRAQNAILAMSQAWGLTKLQMGDIRQLIIAGVPVWDLLSEVTGKTTAQLQAMSKDGTISRQVMGQMFDLMAKKATQAGGAIENLFTTKISNLFDAWQVFTYQVMNVDLGGITVFQELKNDIQAFTDFLRQGFKGDTGKQVAKELASIYHAVKQVAMGFMQAVRFAWPLIEGLAGLVGGFGNLFIIIGGLLALPWIVSLVQAGIAVAGLVSAFTSWIAAGEAVWALLGLGISLMGILQGAAAGIGAVFAFILSPIGLTIAAITSLGYLAYKIIAQWDPAKSFLDNLWNGFMLGLQDAINGVIQLLNLIPGIKIPEVNFKPKVPTVGNPQAMVGRSFAGVNGSKQASNGVQASASSPIAKAVQSVQTLNKIQLSVQVDSQGKASISNVSAKGPADLDFMAKLGQFRPA